MKRKTFTTSIDADISGNFKISCKERGVKMNVILETFMKQFSENDFEIIITKSGIRLEIEEKK